MSESKSYLYGSLKILKDDKVIKKYVLSPKAWTIGSNLNHNIRLFCDPNEILGIVCVVIVQENGLAVLKTKNSTVPIFVNNKKVKYKILHSGDTIEITNNTILYENNNLKDEDIRNLSGCITPGGSLKTPASRKTTRLNFSAKQLKKIKSFETEEISPSQVTISEARMSNLGTRFSKTPVPTKSNVVLPPRISVSTGKIQKFVKSSIPVKKRINKRCANLETRFKMGAKPKNFSVIEISSTETTPVKNEKNKLQDTEKPLVVSAVDSDISDINELKTNKRNSRQSVRAMTDHVEKLNISKPEQFETKVIKKNERNTKSNKSLTKEKESSESVNSKNLQKSNNSVNENLNLSEQNLNSSVENDVLENSNLRLSFLKNNRFSRYNLTQMSFSEMSLNSDQEESFTSQQAGTNLFEGIKNSINSDQNKSENSLSLMKFSLVAPKSTENGSTASEVDESEKYDEYDSEINNSTNVSVLDFSPTTPGSGRKSRTSFSKVTDKITRSHRKKRLYSKTDFSPINPALDILYRSENKSSVKKLNKSELSDDNKKLQNSYQEDIQLNDCNNESSQSRKRLTRLSAPELLTKFNFSSVPPVFLSKSINKDDKISNKKSNSFSNNALKIVDIVEKKSKNTDECGSNTSITKINESRKRSSVRISKILTPKVVEGTPKAKKSCSFVNDEDQSYDLNSSEEVFKTPDSIAKIPQEIPKTPKSNLKTRKSVFLQKDADLKENLTCKLSNSSLIDDNGTSQTPKTPKSNRKEKVLTNIHCNQPSIVKNLRKSIGSPHEYENNELATSFPTSNRSTSNIDKSIEKSNKVLIKSNISKLSTPKSKIKIRHSVTFEITSEDLDSITQNSSRESTKVFNLSGISNIEEYSPQVKIKNSSFATHQTDDIKCKERKRPRSSITTDLPQKRQKLNSEEDSNLKVDINNLQDISNGSGESLFEKGRNFELAENSTQRRSYMKSRNLNKKFTRQSLPAEIIFDETSLLSDKNNYSFISSTDTSSIIYEHHPATDTNRLLENNLTIKKSEMNMSDIQSLKTGNEKNTVTTNKILQRKRLEKEPICSYEDVQGLKRLFEQKSPKNSYENVAGVKKIMSTPKEQKQPINSYEDLRGVKKLLSSPDIPKEPKCNYEDFRGVRKLLSTPQPKKEPVNSYECVVGMKRILRTPKEIKEPLNSYENVEGVKTLFNSYEVLQEPDNNDENYQPSKKDKNTKKEDEQEVCNQDRKFKTRFREVKDKEFYKETKSITDIQTEIKEIEDFKEELKIERRQIRRKRTVKDTEVSEKLIKQKQPEKSYEDLRGVKKLLSCPDIPKEPECNYEDFRGVRKLLSTPKPKKEPVNSYECVVGMKRILRTPKEIKEPLNSYENVEGVKNLFNSYEVLQEPDNEEKYQPSKKEKRAKKEDKQEVCNQKRKNKTISKEAKNKEFDKEIKSITDIQTEIKEIEDFKEELKIGTRKIRRKRTVKNVALEVSETDNTIPGKDLIIKQKHPKSSCEDLRGVNKLLKSRKEPEYNYEDFRGMRKRLSTPKSQEETVDQNCFEDFEGVKTLFNSPQIYRGPDKNEEDHQPPKKSRKTKKEDKQEVCVQDRKINTRSRKVKDEKVETVKSINNTEIKKKEKTENYEVETQIVTRQLRKKTVKITSAEVKETDNSKEKKEHTKRKRLKNVRFEEEESKPETSTETNIKTEEVTVIRTRRQKKLGEKQLLINNLNDDLKITRSNTNKQKYTEEHNVNLNKKIGKKNKEEEKPIEIISNSEKVEVIPVLKKRTRNTKIAVKQEEQVEPLRKSKRQRKLKET